jgi:hypothetical protein
MSSTVTAVTYSKLGREGGRWSLEKHFHFFFFFGSLSFFFFAKKKYNNVVGTAIV